MSGTPRLRSHDVAQRMAEPLAYTIEGAAAAIGVGRTKLYELIMDGRIEARTLDGKTLIPAASLLSLILSLPEAPIKRRPGRQVATKGG